MIATLRRSVALVFIGGLAYAPSLYARADETPTDDLTVAAIATAEPTALPEATPSPAVPAMSAPAPAPTATTAPVSPTSRVPDRAGYSYNYALQDTRYNDVIVSIDAYKPLGNPNARIRPFVDGALVRDSRTSPGNGADGKPPTPLVLSDNYGLVSGGLQYTNGSGLRLFAQGGRSFTVGPVAAQSSGGDLRAGAQLYREWGPTSQRKRDYGNFYGSATYYSRYSDTVAYLQAETARNIGSFEHPIEPFARGVLTLDTRRFYYSNLVEFTLGVRAHPLGVAGPTFSVEAIKGAYLQRSPLPLGVTSTYSDFRPTVSIGFSL